MLSQRASEILSYVQRSTRDHGYPPTIREIGEEFGIASTNGVRYYLNILEKAGHLKRHGKISRGIESLGMSLKHAGIPILGRVAAGQPILAEESLEGHLDTNDVFGDAADLFALRVRGDSMIEAGIHENDYVVVRQSERAAPGNIVVALLEDEATVKYYRPHGGHIELVPANSKYQPIVVEKGAAFQILGIVKGVVRTISS